ncbi:MAG: hypothetical protein JJ866_10220 [Roseibium sp.]|uniref:hypothetical protein n=1 Tax=Roseibium sp. TaxID=1936156 RepID=UPI001B051128|nr:hypothetical protein [Roseibium sp.]MBO6892303.1 hypothetical protein [Roseibium sp.]MBO6929872.1 hypothetical protein [Roseibium sp.]
MSAWTGAEPALLMRPELFGYGCAGTARDGTGLWETVCGGMPPLPASLADMALACPPEGVGAGVPGLEWTLVFA